MQTCTVCRTVNEDLIKQCTNCQANLEVDSVRAQALSQILKSPRARMVQIVSWHDCCPTCRKVQGTHPRNNLPSLPVAGCSGEHGCRCQYEPFVIEVGP